MKPEYRIPSNRYMRMTRFHTSFRLLLTIGCVLSVGQVVAAPPPESPLPVTLTLEKPGYVTAVIERADGRRVVNLVSEVKAQAGALTLNWDLYDVGGRDGPNPIYVCILILPRKAPMGNGAK